VVPIVPPLRSVQAVRLNRTRSIVQQFTSSKEDMPNGDPSTFREFPKRRNDKSFKHLPARCQIPRFRNCENIISIAAVEELTYRQSRLCRLLGNPVAFAVIALLANGKDLSTGEIAKLIGRSVPRTRNILGLEA
jgi:hypothetical protein